MAAMPEPRMVRCKTPECSQVVAHVLGQTIRPMSDISIRRGHIYVICPACGKRTYITRAATEEAA